MKRKDNSDNIKNIIIIVLGVLLILCVCMLIYQHKTSSQTSNANGNNLAASATTKSATTAAVTTAAPTTATATTAAPTEATTVAPKQISASGTYTCDVKDTSLAITYAYAENTSDSYYSSYSWNATLPSDYKYNKYGSPIVAFADENNGILFNYEGAAAGSVYYYVYATTDGGQTWVKADDTMQTTNSPDQCVFIGNDTLMFIDLGVGITVPSVKSFKFSSDSVEFDTRATRLNEITDMISSMTLNSNDGSGHINVTYKKLDNGDEITTDIDLTTYLN